MRESGFPQGMVQDIEVKNKGAEWSARGKAIENYTRPTMFGTDYFETLVVTLC